jgi:hypothetical protein
MEELLEQQHYDFIETGEFIHHQIQEFLALEELWNEIR